METSRFGTIGGDRGTGGVRREILQIVLIQERR
jgi:hypothetical protein